MQDRRRMVRNRVYYGGVLAFNARRSTFACIVRNFSDGGARIEFEGSPLLPDYLDFSIERRDLACRARLVWRGHQEAGLVFADTPQTPEIVSLDLARRLRAGERTNRLLRARLDQLLSGH
ncbi:PilZ domain-containing protein [Bradyrhizobium sp. STM 3557]|uniref:PilZ domain-containing protein n=1 Tax=Bradyrhizobium sp. STM 3557 TaxID=578920 RepID=UPI00388EF580